MALCNRTHDTVLEWKMTEDGWSLWLSGLAGRTPDHVIEEGLRAVLGDSELGDDIRKEVRNMTQRIPSYGGLPESDIKSAFFTQTVQTAVPTALLGKAMAVFQDCDRPPDLKELVEGILLHHDSWAGDLDSNPERARRAIFASGDLRAGLSYIVSTHARSEISLKRLKRLEIGTAIAIALGTVATAGATWILAIS